jgi:hypothetical protein
VSGPNLYAYLRTIGPVAALCGDRIFPERVPQKAWETVARMPCVVFNLVSQSRTATYCETDRIVSAVYQIDHYAPEFDTADQLAEAVRVALRDYVGLMGDTPVRLTRLESARNAIEAEPGLFRASRDWRFWYIEP